MATFETAKPDQLNDILLSQPIDITYNIFFRLPVKTLLRLKSVCKSWLSLISSQEFIKTHLSVSANDPHFTHHGLVIVNWNVTVDLWTCSVYSLLHEPFTETLRRYNDLHMYRVVGCCNGLVLVTGDDDEENQLLLWNPSTKEVRTLPRLDWISSYPDTAYGFSYDESNDDFKTFAISPAHLYNNPNDDDDDYYDETFDKTILFEYKVSVYSLRCDCWRMIGDFPFRLVDDEETYEPDFNDGVFANGSVYWLIPTDQPQKKIILSLDIKSETYTEVLQPNFGDGVYYLNMCTLGKSLSVCQYEHTRVDFWIMKKCGVKVSWTKFFTIPYMDQFITRSAFLKPICISMNGNVLLTSDSNIVIYNLKEKNIKHLLADHYFRGPEVYAYVESLISPHL